MQPNAPTGQSQPGTHPFNQPPAENEAWDHIVNASTDHSVLPLRTLHFQQDRKPRRRRREPGPTRTLWQSNCSLREGRHRRRRRKRRRPQTTNHSNTSNAPQDNPSAAPGHGANLMPEQLPFADADPGCHDEQMNVDLDALPDPWKRTPGEATADNTGSSESPLNNARPLANQTTDETRVRHAAGSPGPSGHLACPGPSDQRGRIGSS